MFNPDQKWMHHSVRQLDSPSYSVPDFPPDNVQNHYLANLYHSNIWFELTSSTVGLKSIKLKMTYSSIQEILFKSWKEQKLRIYFMNSIWRLIQKLKGNIILTRAQQFHKSRIFLISYYIKSNSHHPWERANSRPLKK